jgi:NitT/TauT family transport system substrate-binding protein
VTPADNPRPAPGDGYTLLVGIDTRFLDKLDPRFAATDLVDDRFVRKAIQAVGGPQVFGIPADFSRRETIVV